MEFRNLVLGSADDQDGPYRFVRTEVSLESPSGIFLSLDYLGLFLPFIHLNYVILTLYLTKSKFTLQVKLFPSHSL